MSEPVEATVEKGEAKAKGKVSTARAIRAQKVSLEIQRPFYAQLKQHAQASGMSAKQFLYMLLDLGWKTLLATAAELEEKREESLVKVVGR